jgi:hypothetical protein
MPPSLWRFAQVQDQIAVPFSESSPLAHELGIREGPIGKTYDHLALVAPGAILSTGQNNRIVPDVESMSGHFAFFCPSRRVARVRQRSLMLAYSLSMT